MQPVFSIITVTYNAEKWIERTISSVINQSYKKIEYIIIDGGSKDGTRNIVERFKEYISYSISEPDNGLYDAMNKGLKKATGDYVWFLNAGDLLYSSNVVEEIVCKIKDANILPDIIYGETEIIDKEGISLGMRRLKAPKRLSLNSFKMGMLVCHQSFIVKRALSPEYDTKYRFSADFDWCIRCLKKASYILNIHLIISSFLDEGMTSINRKESLKERYIIMCKYYGKISTNILHVWFAIRFYSFKLKNNRV